MGKVKPSLKPRALIRLFLVAWRGEQDCRRTFLSSHVSILLNVYNRHTLSLAIKISIIYDIQRMYKYKFIQVFPCTIFLSDISSLAVPMHKGPSASKYLEHNKPHHSDTT